MNGTCECPTRFYGDYCENNLCDPSCQNGGTCLLNGTCECPTRFYGDYCENNLCDPSCQNGGNCLLNGTCECPTRFYGDYCENNLCDPSCQNGGNCLLNGTCECPTRFYGDYCENNLCDPSCQNGGNCLLNGTCECPTRFYGDYCENNLCDPSCQNGGNCLLNGTCECPTRFYGDYCENNLCDPSCQNGGNCLLNGTCECPTRFYGDYCENNLCDPSCQNGGNCLLNGTCECPTRFYGDYCENKLCYPSCQNNGTCINEVCECIAKFYGKGCEYCSQCLNGAICILSEKSCICLPGYTGKTCENIICQPECSHEQICNNGSCECPFSYSGTNCEQHINVTNVFATGTKSTGEITSKSQQTQSVKQYSTKSSNSATSTSNIKPSAPEAFASSSIRYAASAVVIVIILMVTFLIIILLILLLSRYRRNKANSTLARAQSPQDFNYQITNGLLVQPDCCIYEEIQQSRNPTTNPYSINNSLVNNTPFDNPLFSCVIESPTITPCFNHAELELTSFENSMYEKFGNRLDTNSDLYQTYETASQCPYTGSSMVVPRSDMRPLTTEVVYTSLDTTISKPSAVEIQTSGTYFNQEDIYWEPPKELCLLFDQMSEKRFREIDRSAVELQDKIGSGQFGQVYKALWHTSGSQTNPFIKKDSLPVAVKTLHSQSTTELQTAFIQEAAIMGQFSHPNVLRLLGIVSRTEPFMIVTELMHTELLKSLFIIRSRSLQRSQILSLLLEFSRQITSGMTYLSSKNFIHRDLAARNVLVGNDLTCRISDFGMSRQLREEGDYYTSKGGKVPLKWTSPEAIFYQRYSEKSDVWSFGMTLYEIWTLGEKPWYGYSNDRVVEALGNSEVMNRPNECPAGIWSVMVQCWEPNKELRPTFEQVSGLLSVSDSTLVDLTPIEN